MTDPVAVTKRLADRVNACRDVLGGRRASGRSGRSMFDCEVISFAHGNGLRPPDSAVVAAGITALLDQDRFPLERYNFLERYEPLEDLIYTTMLREGFPAEQLDSICVDAGTTKLFVSFLMNVAEPGDVLMTAPGFYHGLVGWCRLLDLGLQLVPTTPEHSHKLAYESLESAWRQCQHQGARAPKVLVVFNPTPTGAIYSAIEMAQIARFCDEHHLLAIEDNVFARTRFDLNTPIAHLANDERMCGRVVSVDGCSKADGLANLRIGWAIGPPDLIEKMESIKTATTVAIPYVTLVMAEAALGLSQSTRQRDASEYQKRAAAVTNTLDEVNDSLDLPAGAGLQVVHQPAAGHSIMVDAGDAQPLSNLEDSLQLTEYWLDRTAVAVSPLYSSGFDGREFRLNFASVQHTGRADGGRLNYPTSTDPRPLIASAVAHNDHEMVKDLLRSAERNVGVQPDYGSARRLIHEGLVERIASGLRHRASAHRPIHPNTESVCALFDDCPIERKLSLCQAIAGTSRSTSTSDLCEWQSKLLSVEARRADLRAADNGGASALDVRPARVCDSRRGGQLQSLCDQTASRAAVDL